MSALRTIDRQLIELKIHEYGIYDDALDASMRSGTPAEMLKALDESHTEDEVRQLAASSLSMYTRPRF